MSCISPDPAERKKLIPGRIWSLWDMLRIYAHQYLQLGGKLHAAEVTFVMAQAVGEIAQDASPEERERDASLRQQEREQLLGCLREAKQICGDIGATTSEALLAKAINDPPQTARELDVYLTAAVTELKTRLFFYVPHDRASFYEQEFGWRAAFPDAATDAVSAGNSFAAGLYTGCVFYCMRVLERGLHALADDVGLKPAKPIDVQQWATIIDQITARIKEKREEKGASSSDPKIRIWTDAAAEFFIFKEAWRNQAMHIRASYSESEARRILQAVNDFMQRLYDGNIPDPLA